MKLLELGRAYDLGDATVARPKAFTTRGYYCVVLATRRPFLKEGEAFLQHGEWDGAREKDAGEDGR